MPLDDPAAFGNLLPMTASAYTERPDSRYSAEMLALDVADGDTAHLCRLNETAERMAYYPSDVPGLNDEWKAAYERVQDALMTASRNRRRR